MDIGLKKAYNIFRLSPLLKEIMIFFKLNELIYTNPAKRDKIVLAGFVLGLASIIASIIALLVKFFLAREYVVLHYNIYFGISSLGPWYQIFIIPLWGIVIWLVNFFLSFHYYLKIKIISYFLAISAGAINLILLVASILLIIAN